MNPANELPFSRLVESTVAHAIGERLTPGMAISVVRDGITVYERGFGVSGPGGASVTPSTRFAIGSLTKQFTAVGILLSANAGKLQLSDSLAAYLPALPNAGKITLRELLNHTSGLHDYPYLNEHKWPLTGTISPNAIFALLARDPADFEPGTRFAYSNANYAALAEIIAKVNRTSYAAYLSSAIFRPLGMTTSGYGHAAEERGDAVPATGDGVTWIDDARRISLDLFYGAGGIVSTARDLARWNAALLGVAFLTAQEKTELWEPGHLADGSAVPYAMGFVPAELSGHREVWHNGYAPNAGGYCYGALFTDDRTGVVVLTNSGRAAVETVSMAIVRAVLESYLPQRALDGDPMAAARIAAFLAQVRDGTVDRDQLTARFSAVLTPALLLATQPYFKGLGAPVSLLLEEKNTQGTTTSYHFRGEFSDGSVHDVRFALDGDKIAGFQVPP